MAVTFENNKLAYLILGIKTDIHHFDMTKNSSKFDTTERPNAYVLEALGLKSTPSSLTIKMNK